MNINLENISEIIKIEYGITVSVFTQLNIGFDQNTAVYKIVSMDNKAYFLKIRTCNFTESSLLIPSLIFDITGTANIITIIKTIHNKLYVKFNSLFIVMYPFIDGQSGWEASLTKDQLINFGKFLYSLHSIQASKKYIDIIPKEEFNNKYRKNVKKYLKIHNYVIDGNTGNREFLDIFNRKKDEILNILNCLDQVTREIDYKNLKMCLCHGDIHAGNILISGDKFYVVDWDTVVFAPREKDLMFIGGGIGNKWNKTEEIENFYNGYGNDIVIDKSLIKYFRLERIIQDIYEFYNQILNKKTEKGEKELCIRYFLEQFEKNNVVENALL